MASPAELLKVAGVATGNDTETSVPAATFLPSGTWTVFGLATVGIWLLGTMVGLAGFVRGLVSVCRFRQSLFEPPASRLSATALPGWDAELGWDADEKSSQIPVYASPTALAPMSVGLFHPIIVIPEYLADANSQQRLWLVLRHEAAHISRRDHWVALLQQLVAVFFWWNPLLHCVNRRLREVPELICDDHAAGSRAEGRLLAEALVDVAQRSVTPQRRGATALALDDAGAIECRVRRLLERSHGVATQMNVAGRVTATAFTLLAAGLLMVAQVRAEAGAGRKFMLDLRQDDGKSTGDEWVVPASIGYSKSDRRGLAGKWLLKLPAGFEHRVTLTALRGNRYRITPSKLNMSGVYKLRGNELQIVEPNDSRLTEFVWRVSRRNALVLVEEPPTRKTGASYLGATLTRQPEN